MLTKRYMLYSDCQIKKKRITSGDNAFNLTFSRYIHLETIFYFSQTLIK